MSQTGEGARWVSYFSLHEVPEKVWNPKEFHRFYFFFLPRTSARQEGNEAAPIKTDAPTDALCKKNIHHKFFQKTDSRNMHL